jgi:ATP-dependent Lon protease
MTISNSSGVSFLDDLERKIADKFPGAFVDKDKARALGLDKALPSFLVDWLVSKFTVGDDVDKMRVKQFVDKYLPDKSKAEHIKSEIVGGAELKIIDRFGVSVNVSTGIHELSIPSLDLTCQTVLPSLIEKYPRLLSGSEWGLGTLSYNPYVGSKKKGSVVLVDFQPFQAFSIDLDYYIDQRSHFTIEEWIDLIIRSMEYNSDKFTFEQKLLMLARLVPVLQPRVNQIELGAKGTGKSFVYTKLSKYVWLISGGVVTRAQLLYDMSRKKAGIITLYDHIVLDEIQTIDFDKPEEIIGALKGYLESGAFNIASYSGTASSGIGILGNIKLTKDHKPVNPVFVVELPPFMQETAFLDRYHVILPGWCLPRLNKDHIVSGLALNSEYVSEIFHDLRLRTEYYRFVEDSVRTKGDLRDINAVKSVATGLLKLLFPNLDRTSKEEFAEFCLEPAIEYRRNLREQLNYLDPEYKIDIADIRVS